MRTYSVKKVKDIDISCVDSAWNEIEPGVLLNNADGSKADLKSEFRLAYNEHYLFFMYDLEDMKPKATMKNYNDPIYDEETIEFFLATTSDKKDYLELELNFLNTKFAANIDNDLVGHTTLHFIKDCPIESNVISRDGGWYAVGKVDASAFKGEMKDSWLFNAFRIKRREDDSMKLYAYSPTFIENFHKPDYFVKLRFER